MFDKCIENFKKKRTIWKIKFQAERMREEERALIERKNRQFLQNIQKYNCYPPKFENGQYIATDKNFRKIVYDSILKGGENISLNFINTTYVTDMSYLFSPEGINAAIKNGIYGDTNKNIRIPCDKFVGDISSWDVSHVTNFEGMFYQSNFNGNLSKWRPSKAVNMKGMFSHSSFTGDNGDISDWDVSQVKDMSEIFCQSKYSGNISSWDVSNVINFDYAFYGCSPINSLLCNWDTSSAIKMKCMFGNISWQPDIENWNVSHVKDMEGMFKDSSFNVDISAWDVSDVVNMNEMFKNSKFNQDISCWNTSSLESANCLFYNCPFKGSILNWNTFKVLNLPSMMQRGYYY